MKEKIGLGVVTYKRPDYFKECIEHILKYSAPLDYISIYNDGSPEDTYKKVYEKIFDNPKIVIEHPKENKGVAKAKNFLLKDMLDEGCEHLFLIEDDILIESEKVFSEYIRVAKETGFHHLMFAHHGEGNKDNLVYKDENVSYWGACVGAFCYYSRYGLETLRKYEEEKGLPFAGFMDENFKNAWEHVEHTKRLGDLALTSPFGLFIDITDSPKYLKEIEGSIDNSSIRPESNWAQNQIDGLAYWEKKEGVRPPIELPDHVQKILDEKAKEK